MLPLAVAYAHDYRSFETCLPGVGQVNFKYGGSYRLKDAVSAHTSIESQSCKECKDFYRDLAGGLQQGLNAPANIS